MADLKDKAFADLAAYAIDPSMQLAPDFFVDLR
jgi:hypothetical protein